MKRDQPSAEFFDEEKWWFSGTLRHRIDGPAIECSDGNNRWFLYDTEYSEEEFNSLPEVIMHKEGLDIFT